MNTKQIINILKNREVAFKETNTFSQQAGIYALFFIGNSFPLLGNSVKKHQIIYIGKTESSQEKRDANTHFASGKTGSSTVRKSIGSLLCTQTKLVPIPRNSSDYKRGKMSHFKFDKISEQKVTKWMENNLALSFFEYPKSNNEIEDLETKIILALKPILNISKNLDNPFKNKLQQLRKNCAQEAAKQSKVSKTNISTKAFTTPTQNNKPNNQKSKGKYIDLWSNKKNNILALLKKATSPQTLQLSAEQFRVVGNRKNYSFNLEFNKGKVDNNISGNAVARDLATVLTNTNEIVLILQNGHYKLNMDKQYCLTLRKK